jgi:FtsH-binding integral membrane protein
MRREYEHVARWAALALALATSVSVATYVVGTVPDTYIGGLAVGTVAGLCVFGVTIWVFDRLAPRSEPFE